LCAARELLDVVAEVAANYADITSTEVCGVGVRAVLKTVIRAEPCMSCDGGPQ